MDTDDRQLAEKYAQAMWDALGILGFDLDGDQTPAALIAGMGPEGFIKTFLRDVQEERDDHDDLLMELDDLQTSLHAEIGQ